MKRIILLIILFIAVFHSKLFSQYEGEICSLHEYVGIRIEWEEREYYHLFPYVEGFGAAVVTKIDDENYRVIFAVRADGTVKHQFNDYTKNEIDSMSKRIESIGKMKRTKMEEVSPDDNIIFTPRSDFIDKGKFEFTFSGSTGKSSDELDDEMEFYSRLSGGIGYFASKYFEIGLKGTSNKIEGFYGSGSVLGTMAVNIPTVSNYIYFFFGGGCGCFISGEWDELKKKNVRDYDFQVEAFLGGKFFLMPNAAIVIQPFYRRTVNAPPFEDINELGMSYGISLFF